MPAEASHDRGSGSPAIPPRLLNLRQMAQYLGCSYWTARDYVLAGYLPVVELPPLRPREGERARKTLRRVLVDREDLDRFIEQRKAGGSQDL
jgi:predicted site-specific integrase-resolvase